MRTALNRYWTDIALTLLAVENSPRMRSLIAREVVLRVDETTASDVLDFLYFESDAWL